MRAANNLKRADRDAKDAKILNGLVADGKTGGDKTGGGGNDMFAGMKQMAGKAGAKNVGRCRLTPG